LTVTPPGLSVGSVLQLAFTADVGFGLPTHPWTYEAAYPTVAISIRLTQDKVMMARLRRRRR